MIKEIELDLKNGSQDKLTLRVVCEADLPKDYARLKKQIYLEEIGYLSQNRLDIPEESGATHVIISDKQGRVIGHVQVQKAETSEVILAGFDGRKLKNAAMLTRGMLDPEYRGKGLFATLMYVGLSVARMWGRTQMVCLVEKGEIPAQNILKYEFLSKGSPYIIIGHNSKVFEMNAGRQYVELALELCWNAIPSNLQLGLKPLLSEQVELFLEERLEKFMQGPWFQQIYSKQLTRDQYIVSLANMYQFVRMTTRILASAVGVTSDAKLRRHFIDHLTGEVDHEVMIESDLKHLKADVNFVKNQMIANPQTLKFMVIQESMLSHYRDPVRYLAVPFSIEGFSARLDQHFISCLEESIARYGVNPKRSMTFLSSHIETDGGDDGHWQKNLEIIRHLMTSEQVLKGFLGIIQMTIDAMDECYSSYVSSYGIDQITGIPNATSEGQLPSSPRSPVNFPEVNPTVGG